MRSCVYMLVAVQALVLKASSMTTSDCPLCGNSSDWTRVDNEPFCYHLHITVGLFNWVDYDDAETYCEYEQNAHLPVLVTDQSRKNFEQLATAEFDTKDVNGSYYVYPLGLKKVETEWKWPDGTPQDLSLLTNETDPGSGHWCLWGPGRGDEREQQYVTLLEFRSVRSMYCQKDCPITTTIEPRGSASATSTPATTSQRGVTGQSSKKRGKGLDTGLVVGVGAAGFCLILILSFLATTVYQKRKRKAMACRSIRSSVTALPKTARGDQPSVLTPSDTLYDIPGLEAYSRLNVTDRTDRLSSQERGAGTQSSTMPQMHDGHSTPPSVTPKDVCTPFSTSLAGTLPSRTPSKSKPMSEAEMPELKKYTRAEVEEHKSSKSCWIIIDNKVYDVTKFLDDHPGGVEILLEHAGIDGTEDFEDTGHSTDARTMRDEYYIGELVDEDKRTYNAPQDWNDIHKKKSSGWSNILIPGMMTLGAVFLYRFFFEV